MRRSTSVAWPTDWYGLPDRAKISTGEPTLQLSSFVSDERGFKREDLYAPSGWSSWSGPPSVKHESEHDSFLTRKQHKMRRKLAASFKLASLGTAREGAARDEYSEAEEADGPAARMAAALLGRLSSDTALSATFSAMAPDARARLATWTSRGAASSLDEAQALQQQQQQRVEEFGQSRNVPAAALLQARQTAARHARQHQLELRRLGTLEREQARLETQEGQRVHARARRALRETLAIERLVESAVAIGEATRVRELCAAEADRTRIRLPRTPPPDSQLPAESDEQRRARLAAEAAQRAARQIERVRRQSASGIAERRAHAAQSLSAAVSARRPPLSERPWAAAYEDLSWEADEAVAAHARVKQLARSLSDVRFAARFPEPDLPAVALQSVQRWQAVRAQGAELDHAAHELSRAHRLAAQRERELETLRATKQLALVAENVRRAREGQPRLRTQLSAPGALSSSAPARVEVVEVLPPSAPSRGARAPAALASSGSRRRLP